MSSKITQLCFVVLFISLAGVSTGKYSGGSGTSEEPYLIATPNDLNSIGLDSNDWDRHFKMIADVNMDGYTGTQFNIIGGYTPYFSGVFDGNDNQIQRFTYIDKTRVKAGIFGRTTESSEIRNVHLVDVNLCGYYDVGGLVSYNLGKVEQCSVTGVVSGTEDVGGLVGENRNGGWIENCNADVTIQNYGPQSYVGCLVGFNNSDTDIIDCSSAGIVDGNDNTHLAGGLVGSNNGRIKRCFSTAEVKGSWCVGGLIGVHDEYDLENCFATGNISAEVRGGGLVGFSKHTIINCYATGDVNCTKAAGGLIGEEGYGGALNCYSTGYVTGNQDVGGLVGVKYTTEDFICCFWDVNTSGQTTSAGGTGKTTSEMKHPNTFTDAGWDMVNIWDIGENQTYPFLRTHLPSDINKDDEINFIDLAILAAHWLDEK